MIYQLFSRVEVLNLDYVKDQQRREKKDQNQWILLLLYLRIIRWKWFWVDFKLNIRNFSALKDDLEGKVNDSMLFLGNSIPIHNQYIFIFQSSKVQQARNRLQRMVPKIPNNYVAIDLSELIQKYFQGNQFNSVLLT